ELPTKGEDRSPRRSGAHTCLSPSCPLRAMRQFWEMRLCVQTAGLLRWHSGRHRRLGDETDVHFESTIDPTRLRRSTAASHVLARCLLSCLRARRPTKSPLKG